MIKIFFKERFISLSSEAQVNTVASTKSVRISRKSDLKVLIKNFSGNEKIHHLNLYGMDENEALKKMEKCFKPMPAGGGLVYHPKEKAYLFIFRRGKWDIPKGKSEKGERIEQTALREVAEECSLDIKQLHITGFLDCSYHSFKKNGDMMLKETHWYHMEYTGNPDDIRPQKEEDIEECKWVKPRLVSRYLGNSYASIRSLLEGHYKFT